MTLLDQQPGEGKRAAAAHAVLTRGVGQPGALDPSVSDRWAGPTATLYNDLNTAAPDPDRPTLPDLPLRYRYRRCFPAKQFDKLDAPTSHSA